jgi:TetR/AcrR family transcriptional regulator, cholesterol catabolism regulator
MNTATAPEDMREAISNLKRERILAAAVDLFYRQGYGKTTLDQVASELQVTKPFIYAHFASKNELLVEICSRAITLAHDALNRAMSQDASVSERLETVVSDFLTAVLNHQPHAMIYSREEKELTQKDRDTINQLRRDFDRRLVELVQQGVASGEFQVDDVQLTTLAIGGIVGWAPVWYRANGRLSLEEVVSYLASMVLAMVRAKKNHKSQSSK